MMASFSACLTRWSPLSKMVHLNFLISCASNSFGSDFLVQLFFNIKTQQEVQLVYRKKKDNNEHLYVTSIL